METLPPPNTWRNLFVPILHLLEWTPYLVAFGWWALIMSAAASGGAFAENSADGSQAHANAVWGALLTGAIFLAAMFFFVWVIYDCLGFREGIHKGIRAWVWGDGKLRAFSVATMEPNRPGTTLINSDDGQYDLGQSGPFTREQAAQFGYNIVQIPGLAPSIACDNCGAYSRPRTGAYCYRCHNPFNWQPLLR